MISSRQWAHGALTDKEKAEKSMNSKRQLRRARFLNELEQKWNHQQQMEDKMNQTKLTAEKIAQLKAKNAGNADENLDGAIPLNTAWCSCNPQYNYWECDGVKLIDGAWYSGTILWDMDHQAAETLAEDYDWDTANVRFFKADELETEADLLAYIKRFDK